MSLHIIDIETDGIDNPQHLWCIVCRDTATEAVSTFSFPSGVPGDYPEVVEGFLSSSNSASGFIGHNIISYDLPILSKFIPRFSLDRSAVIDTLVVARLLNYAVDGGNSLEAWGERLGCPKSSFSNFSQYSQEMLDYCIQDVHVTGKLYAALEPYISSSTWRAALRLEHDTAWLCNDLHTAGFHFDIAKAQDLHLAISTQLGSLRSTLSHSFRPRVVDLGRVDPKLTKSGTLNRSQFRFLGDSGDLSHFNGGPFSRIGFEPFNPGSPKQCVERLWEFGWRPTDRTKGHIAAERALADLSRRHSGLVRRGGRLRHAAGSPGHPEDNPEYQAAAERLKHFAVYGWKVNETNLATLPREAPESAHKLVEWLMLDSRRSTLEEWFEAYNPATQRIHGRFNHIGAWTGRMSHNSPNMANIPGHGSAYGDEFRALWQAIPGKFLVGADADGIQLRILAHYMNDKDFIEALTKGRKEDGTDAHTLNQRALGHVCSSRDVAKTFVYAFLLGAGKGKISEILGCSVVDAEEAVQKFIDYYPGLRALRDFQIPSDASRGYFVGLDGRAVVCDSAHHMLAGYLQNGEAVVMKKANLIWRDKLRREGIQFQQVNFVHDEWQVEVESLTDATLCGTILVSSIEEAGKQLNLNCPLAGNFKIGTNWLETH